MTVDILLPWQRQALQIWQQRSAQRLAQSYFWVAEPEFGLEAVCAAWISQMLCAHPQSASSGACCGACVSCCCMQAGTHSDVHWLRPEGSTATIKVDAVRAVRDFVDKTAAMAAYRFVVITAADRLNDFAANALLKILEEPGRDLILVLMTHRPANVLATIRSRCQQWVLPMVDRRLAVRWLIEVKDVSEQQAQKALLFARHAPLRARMWLESGWIDTADQFWPDLLELMLGNMDPVSLADRYKVYWNLPFMSDVMAQWVEDLWHAVVLPSGSVTNFLHHARLLPDYERIIGVGLNIDLLWQVWQRLVQTPVELAGNVQPLLWFESVFIDFSGLCGRRRVQ